MPLVFPFVLATKVVQKSRQDCCCVMTRAALPERIRREKRRPEHYASNVTNTVRAVGHAWRHKTIRSWSTKPGLEFGYDAERCGQPAHTMLIRLTVLHDIPEKQPL